MPINNKKDYIQSKWREGLLPLIDGISFANGDIIIANTYRLIDTENNTSKRYWSPLCDTTIESVEKYEGNAWVCVDIFNGEINYGNGKIVFGDGGMGSDGFVAHIDENGDLIWGIFFTFSNPIISAKIIEDKLICMSDAKIEVIIQLNDITKISIIEHPFDHEEK
ncbi:hypothetical protein HYN56_23220 [Flavobacterium crocinum]|uniref:Uncharacterized protein n=1 Tax=Flavobacterium crocinum TaxID=2183896 RepID=A0A2S1YSL3_9FLAO|nr:hypothetical protein [Flavobacterium crocinum]AWK06982.1 hypothetical protein HYN56_23220 [Flavobacterium crocinum]